MLAFVDKIQFMPCLECREGYELEWHDLMETVRAQRLLPIAENRVIWESLKPFKTGYAMQELSRRVCESVGSVHVMELETLACMLTATLCPHLYKLEFEDNNVQMNKAFTALLSMHDEGWNCLRQLTTLELFYWDTENSMNLDTVAAAWPWPTLTKFIGWMVGENYQLTPLPSRPPGTTFAIQQVFLENSGLEPETIKHFVTPMRALRSFTYQHDCVTGVTFCAAAICTALQDAVGTTLEHLCLNMEHGVFEEYMSPIQDLRGFTKLKSLELDLRWLLCDEVHPLPSGRSYSTDVYIVYGKDKSVKVPKLHEMLPSSIERLKLNTSDLMREMSEMVDGLHLYKDAYLPKLSYVGLAYKDDQSQLEAIQQALSRAHVEFEQLGLFLGLRQIFTKNASGKTIASPRTDGLLT